MPSVEEQKRLDNLASWYADGQLGLDRQLVGFRYECIRDHLKGPNGLELGSAEGTMTSLLLPHFDSLTVVEGAAALLDQIPSAPGLRKVASLFEDFEPGETFDSIVMDHVLEHVADPVDLLIRASNWLSPEGRLIAGVPNGNSIHRLAAVRMGLLEHPCQLNDRDHAVGHRRVYTPQSLARDVELSRLTLIDRGGVFLKPLSNAQIEQQWTRQQTRAFFELGRALPELAAEIFVVCRAGAPAIRAAGPE